MTGIDDFEQKSIYTTNIYTHRAQFGYTQKKWGTDGLVIVVGKFHCPA